jgi:hypothetical protein
LHSVALLDDGHLLLGGVLAGGLIPVALFLDAAGQVLDSHSFPGERMIGPWSATRDGTHAFGVLTYDAADTEVHLDVRGLDEERGLSWEQRFEPATDWTGNRAVIIHPDGKTYVTTGGGSSLEVTAVDPDGSSERVELSAHDGGAVHALGVAQTGELLVGGSVGGDAWLAAYDL